MTATYLQYQLSLLVASSINGERGGWERRGEIVWLFTTHKIWSFGYKTVCQFVP